MALIQPQQLLAVGFGETTMCALQHLSGFIASQQVRLVTLSGGVGSYMTGIGQLDAACQVSIIPARCVPQMPMLPTRFARKTASEM